MARKSETPGPANSRFEVLSLVAETGSTNADLADLALRGAPEGTVLIADHQTAGRGRQGRTWLDQPGCSLMMSWLMRPNLNSEALGLVPLLTGLAVTKALDSVGVAASLKWPNDILVGRRKLGGILCESQMGDTPAIIVGVGMNLFWAQAPPAEIAEHSTILADHASAGYGSRDDLARLILSSFEKLWTDFETPAGSERLLHSYSAVCSTLAEPEISFSRPDGTSVVGRPDGIDAGGGLWLRSHGKRELLTAGDAHHIKT